MSERSISQPPKKKPRGRGKFHDTLPLDVVPSPLDQSLQPILSVQKCAILQKNKSFPGASTSRVSRKATVSEASSMSNESYTSVLSNFILSQDDAMDCSKVADFTNLDTTCEELFETVPLKEDSVCSKDSNRSVICVPREDTLNVTDELDTDQEHVIVSPERIVETKSPKKLPSRLANITESQQDPEEQDTDRDDLDITPETKEINHPVDSLENNFEDDLALVLTSQAFLEAVMEDTNATIEELARTQEKERVSSEELKHCIASVMDGDIGTSERGKIHPVERVCREAVEELATSNLVADGKLAAQEELIACLYKRIEELEARLKSKEKDCKEELESILAKSIGFEVLLAAKTDVEKEVVQSQSDSTETNRTDDGRKMVEHVLAAAEEEVLMETFDEFDRAAMVGDFHRATLANEPHFLDVSKNYSPQRLKKCPLQKKPPDGKFQCLEDKIKCLKTEKEDRESKFIELTERFSDLEARYNSLESEKAVLEQELEMKIKMCDDVKKDHELVLAEKAKLEMQIRSGEAMEMQLAHLKAVNIDLEKQTVDLAAKLNQLETERDVLVQKELSLDSTVAELQENLKNLIVRNEELQKTAGEYQTEHELRLSVTSELEKLRREFRNSLSFDQSFNLSSVMKDLRASGASVDWPIRDSMRRTCDSTFYLGVAQIDTKEVSCQTAPSKKDVSCQSHEEQYNSICGIKSPCDRSKTLQKDLEASWTERCEIENKLAAALSELEMLRRQTRQLEATTRCAFGLMDAGVPSASVWLQLRTYIRDIVAEIGVLRTTPTILDVSQNSPGASYNSPYNSTEYLSLRSGIPDVGNRSSPEGGRESPPVVDGRDRPTNNLGETISLVGDANDAEENTMDQNSVALSEIVHCLRRICGEEKTAEVSTNFNESLNSTLNISHLADSGEIYQLMQHVMEEVARLLAMSRRGDDPTVRKLKEQVLCLESQLQNSDKQVRSTRAFLEDQAVEREIERDEAAQRIEELTDLLRTRDRQLASKEILEQDMVIFEQRISELQSSLYEESERRTSAEKKLEQTMCKVRDLREILENLESQLADRSKQLEVVKVENDRLKLQIVEVDQISLEREAAQKDSMSDTLRYVNQLEEKLTALQHEIDAVGPESVTAARNSLRDLEITLARRTRALELVQLQWYTGLSSASEELSTRDNFDATRCATPDEMACEGGVALCADVERLKERLVKHGRAEEAALKRIKELEVNAGKVDELKVDLEAALHRVDSLLSENESIKARLENERPRTQDAEIISSLTCKVQVLEKQIDEMKNELENNKKILTEKIRRVERLEEVLRAREMDLSAESSELARVKEDLSKVDAQLRIESEIVRTTRNQLETETSLRVAAEKKFDELLQKWTEESSIGRKSEESKTSAESSSSVSKRVRFHVPPDFVSSSVTPITDGSILRDAPSTGWIDIEPAACKKQMPWESISSVAALQLSPRNVPLTADSSLDLPSPSSLISVDTVHELKQKNQLLESQLLEREAEISKAKETLEILQKEQNILLGKEAKSRNALDVMEAKLAGKMEEIKVSRRVIDEKENELTILKKELAMYKVETSKINLLAEQVQLAQSAQQEVNEELIATKEVLKLTQTELEALRDSAERKESDLLAIIQKLEYEKLEVENGFHLAKKEAETLMEEAQSHMILLKKLEEERDALQILLDDANQWKMEKGEASLVAELKARVEILEPCFTQLMEEKAKVNQLTDRLNSIAREEQKARGSDHDKKNNQARISVLEAEKNELEQLINEIRDEAEENREKWQKLCGSAAAKVAELRKNLENSLSRVASLENELSVARECLESSEGRVLALKIELEEEVEAKRLLVEELKALKTQQCLDNPGEVLVLSVELEKTRSELLRVKASKAELKNNLKVAVNIGKSFSDREGELREKLSQAEREVLRLTNLLETQVLKFRELERQKRHEMALQQNIVCMDLREVRSAGGSEARPDYWQMKAMRLESHRRALVFQKEWLLSRCKHVLLSRKSRRPTLRIVAILIISIKRMHFLVHRRQTRFPPIRSPPRRVGELPLMLAASPPCKDPGMKLQQRR